jgi:hypothetical protein
LKLSTANYCFSVLAYHQIVLWVSLVKAFKKYFFLFIIIFLKWVSNDSFAQGQTQTTVVVSPSSMTVRPSFTVTLDVRVDDVANIFAASVTLAFDSTILRYSSVTGGSFLTKNNTNSVFLGVVPQPPPPAAPNKITFDQAIPGGGTVSGSGVLFTIKFTALRVGSSPITIISVDLRNGSNTSILTQTVSGQVTVNQSPSIASSPVLTALTNRFYQYQVQGSDPDGDTLRYGLIAAPAFLSITSSTGLISGIPTSGSVGKHTVTVQVEDGKGGSDQQTYTLSVVSTNNAPTAVQLLSPPNGSTTDTPLTVMLMWSKSIDIDTGDEVRYEVYLKSAFSNMCMSNLLATTLTLTKDVLKANTEYTWYVDATDGSDTTSSTQTFKFKTPVAGFKQYPVEISDVLKVEQNYPNPFNSSTVIRFSVSIATQVFVMVYDMTGREIIRLMSDNVEAGYYTVTWDGKNSKGVAVGSGTYLYVITAGWYRAVKKMILLK